MNPIRMDMVFHFLARFDRENIEMGITSFENDLFTEIIMGGIKPSGQIGFYKTRQFHIRIPSCGLYRSKIVRCYTFAILNGG